MRQPAVNLSLALLAAAIGGCNAALVRVSEPFTLDLPWSDYQRVVVHTTNGGVELSSDSGDGLRISGVKAVGGLTLAEAHDNLDRLTIVAKPDDADPATFVIALEFPPELRSKSPGASFDICIPQPGAAEIVTGNGRIRVRGLKDAALLSTSNGSIRIDEVAGDVEAATSNGTIVVRSVAGECRLRTSNGRVEVRDAAGDVRVATSNGSVRVQAAPGPEGEVILQTSNGSILLDLPANLRGELSLHCSNGHLRTELAGAALTRPRTLKHSFEAEMNGGGPGRIVAHTSNGSITLTCH